MLKLFGSNALSEFKRNKLLQKIQSIDLSVTNIKAQYIYFLKLKEMLTKKEIIDIKKILKYNDKVDLRRDYTNHFVITPRRCTVSSWSSKATDILKNSGFEKICNIEQGIIYYIYASKKISKSSLIALGKLTYDRMTEEIHLSFDRIGNFTVKEQSPENKIIPIIEHGKKVLFDLNKLMGLALSKNEINYLYTIFKEMNRNPNDVEIMMFAQANSEHCRHKIFKANWFVNNQKQRDSLFDMIKNTHHANNQGVISAYDDNAAIIQGHEAETLQCDSSQKYYFKTDHNHIQIKVETHNHPTAISPQSGAATGAGGEIRDESATGQGGRPKAGMTGYITSNLEIPSFKQPWEVFSEKPKHIASALRIMIEAPIGSAKFNNEFGRPNICGFFRTYEQNVQGKLWGYHKPIMIAGGYGNIKASNIRKEIIPIDANIIVFGGPGMLIGLGGGASSSVLSNHLNKELDFSSVQRDNAEMQLRAQAVIDTCCAMEDVNPIISIHDVGAGGLANAIPELVSDCNRGALINLEDIPVSEENLSALEIWCNEAQERYVCAIKEENISVFDKIAIRERCPYNVVGKVTKTKNIVLKSKFSKQYLINLPLSKLLDVPFKLNKKVKPNDINIGKKLNYSKISLLEAVNRILSLPCVASKNFLITIGDRSVGGLTIRDQMIGPWQIPISNVGITAVSFNSTKGEAIAVGERPALALTNPKAASRMAVGEAITNIISADINNLSDIKLSANWMASGNDITEAKNLYDMVKVIGMEFCPALNITIPVGKDSLSMKTSWKNSCHQKRTVTSPVSLIITAFSTVNDIKKTLTPELKKGIQSNLILIDLGNKKNRMGGSSLNQTYNFSCSETPDIEVKTLNNFFLAVNKLRKMNMILAYHDRSDGGLFVTLCEMMFSSRLGLNVYLDNLGENPIQSLFSEELGAVIQVRNDEVESIMSIFNEFNLSVSILCELPKYNSQKELNIFYKEEEIFSESCSTLQKTWSKTSFHIQSIRDNPQCAQQEYDTIEEDNEGLFAEVPFKIVQKSPYIDHKIKPKIAILREQGTNGHKEMAAAFTLNGFEAIDIHMTDLQKKYVKLDDFKGIAACGGFSYGDVLGAGGGWANSILFNDYLRNCFLDFFHRKDTFSIGVCNGCQMLSQIRELIPGAKYWPTFVENISNQFEARLSMVEILKSPSIIFHEMENLKIPIVVSHGQGKASYSNKNDINRLNKNNQSTMQYLDYHGSATERYPMNPNGSILGITGFTTEDGRCTIMMPHPERVFIVSQMSWYPNQWNEKKMHFSPWMKLFMNARSWVN